MVWFTPIQISAKVDSPPYILIPQSCPIAGQEFIGNTGTQMVPFFPVAGNED